jgi:hypothetical protein
VSSGQWAVGGKELLSAFLPTAYCLLPTVFPTPTDKVHDLNAIIFSKYRRFPLRAAHDLMIKFDGNSFRRKVEVGDKLLQREDVCYFTSFTINLKLQEILRLIYSCRLDHTPQLCFHVIRYGTYENRCST